MKVYLQTFGCRANQYDTEAVRAMVLAAGRELVDTPDDADVAVFNSCAVTAEAEADLRKHVRRAARRQPALRSVVMGCAASVSHDAIAALPSVADVVPGADLDAVARALGLPRSARLAAPVAQAGTRALLRIQDGCDEHCTFCTTTIARGANRSRDPAALVDEAGRLAERHGEIVITGIHIGSYGTDIDSSLSRLVERLVREIPAVRFRLSSLEATEVDERLADLFDDPARVAPHLHAPLQSGADRVLKRMGRHWYTAGSYRDAVEKLLVRHSVFALGADVIAGFPGETDDDHAATVALIEALPFTYLHVFPFSLRPGTAAERLPAHVPTHRIEARARALRALADRKSAAYRQSRLGGDCDLLVLTADGVRHGMTEDYLDVRVTGDPLPRGTRVRARLGGDVAQLLATPVTPIIQP